MPNQGYLTASTFPDLMTKGRGGAPFGKTAMKHIEQLALDLLEVERGDDISAPSLDWGIENEDNARYLYQKTTLSTVVKPEFRVCPDLSFVGGTMDGLVGVHGGVEFKCPKNSAKHLFHFDEHYDEYVYQVQGYLWIYGLKWIDFVSYDPRCTKPDHKLKIKRVEPDTGIINELKERCVAAREIAIKLTEQVRTTS